MPFAYYRRLSRRDQATYRKSDALHVVELPLPEALHGFLADIHHGLDDDDYNTTQKATHRFANALLDQLDVSPVTVRVMAVRPSDDVEELHGLYEQTDGRPLIRVWMRTAAHQQPVAFRTFVRTVLHEVCHHLDFEHFLLADSFHTEGFFKRESHLVRQLLGDAPPRQKREKDRANTEPSPTTAVRSQPTAQLDLFSD